MTETTQLTLLQRRLLILALIIGTALLLLFPLAKPVWTDEWISIRWGHQPIEKILTGRFGSPDALPLHPLILHLVGIPLGDTLAVHRILSALPAAVGLWYVWLLASRLGRDVGLLAVWLAALSPGLVLFDRMSRYHGITTLLAAMSCYYFLRTSESDDRKTVVKYGVATALMLLSYTLTMFVVAVQSAFLVLRWKSARRPLWIVAAMALAGAAFLGYLVPNIVRASHTLALVTVEDPTMGQGVSGFLRRSLLPVYVFCVGETLAPWNVVALPGCFVAIAMFLCGLWKLRTRPELVLPAVCFSVVMLSALATSGKLGGAQTVGSMAKRVSFVLPLFYITLSVGVFSLSRPLLRRVSAALLLGIGLYSTTNYWRGLEFLNPNYTVNWSGALAQMRSQRLDASTAVYGGTEFGIQYYFQEGRFDGQLLTSPDTASMKADLKASGKRYCWLIGRDRGDRIAVAEFDEAEASLEKDGAKKVYAGGFYPRTDAERRWLGKALKREIWPTYLRLDLYDMRPIDSAP